MTRAGALGRLGAALAEDDPARDALERRRRARRVTSPIVWPTSSIRPTLWALIAARSSGASAIRSTSRCASSLASSRRQTSSTISLSSASIRACLTVSLSSAPWTASSTSRALQDPDQRPFDRLALDRGDHRLLGGASTARSIPPPCRPSGRRAHRHRAGAPRAAAGPGNRGRQPSRASIRSLWSRFTAIRIEPRPRS